MKTFFKKYFTFNKRERNGVIVLLTILLVLIISIQLLPFFVSQPARDFSKTEIKISHKPADTIEQNTTDPEFDQNEEPAALKSEIHMDPNTASEEELKRAGLSKKLINTLIKYRGKGGKFKTAADLKKIYGMNDSIFLSVSRFIQMDGDTLYASAKRSSGSQTVLQIVELNSADSLSFVMLKGIGSSFAHRIIAFRNKLGGFYSVTQMQEVYGMDSLRFNSIKDNLTVDNSLVTRLNINTASAADLKKHPYINHNLANLIVAYRTTHGPYKSVDDVKKLNLVNDDLYRKLVAYLKVE